MAQMQWTAAQKTAIDDRGGTLLVSAAAGSGKTAVLTERVVELLQDPVHPLEADRLLVVTFTNAAAAELRARIAARLEQVLLAAPHNNRLRRQKLLLPRAHICTIDAFCLDLLHHHFTALDIPPDFTTADAGVVSVLRQEALNEVLELAYQDEDFCAFADLYGRGRSDGAARDAILQVDAFLRALPFGEQTTEDMLRAWRTPEGFANAPWRAVLTQRIYALAQVGEALAKEALAQCADDAEEATAQAMESKKTAKGQEAAVQKAAEKYAQFEARLQALCDVFVAVRTCLHRPDGWDDLYALFAPYRDGTQPVPGLKGMKMRLTGTNKQSIKAQADEASALLDEMQGLVVCSTAEAEHDRAIGAPMLEALFRAVALFEARFYQKKRDKKMLEFSDFEHLTLALLKEEATGERTALAAHISARFDAIMVDEYQDTNALQEEIYRRLARPTGDNLFFVGDLKQSIYRFRQADPSIFAQKQESFAPLAPDAPRAVPIAGQAGQNAVLALDANFRSSAAVVSAVNDFFDVLMSKELGGTAYGAGQRLVCQGGGALEGCVEVLLDTVGGEEPLRVAQKISELLACGAKGEACGMVRDGGSVRPVRAEDCCILLSTRAPFEKYVQALAQYGIAAYADSAEDLLSASHIQPLIALLQIIDNPAQDLPLAAAMLSVLFGFTEDDLVALRLRRRKGSLYGALAHVAVQENTLDTEDAFAQKILHFYEQLSALRQLSHSLSPEELLAEIFVRTHYLALVGAMEHGARRREDVSRFVDFVARAGVNGIEQLVRNIAATIAAGGLTNSAPSAVKQGCVSIMTIHRSKGLQFPVVFVAHLEHTFNTDDLKKKLLLNRQMGVGLQLRAGAQGQNYHTLASAALRLCDKQELLSEEMRLLYVALTRAQDHLYLSGSVRNLGKKLSNMATMLAIGGAALLHSRATNFADWVLCALLQHPSGGALRALCTVEDVPVGAQTGALAITIFEEPCDAPAKLARTAVLTATPDAAAVQSLKEGFAWVYPNEMLTALPAKVSVTSLVHKEQSTALERPAFLAKDGMSATEKGTALHAYLENADFAVLKAALAQGGAALRAALAAETQRQISDRQLVPELAQKLDAAHLEAFFGGEAFARVCAAKQVHREYAFITGLPAHEVLAASGMQTAASDTVLVQGIADLVLVFDDHIELLDYKSDRSKNAAALRKAYQSQLAYYAKAIEKRFAPLPLTYKAIYAFALDALVEV